MNGLQGIICNDLISGLPLKVISFKGNKRIVRHLVIEKVQVSSLVLYQLRVETEGKQYCKLYKLKSNNCISKLIKQLFFMQKITDIQVIY